MALCKMLGAFQGGMEMLFGVANTMLTLPYISRIPSQEIQDARHGSQGHYE